MTETKDIFEKLPKIHFITLGDGTKGVSFTLKEWNQLKPEKENIEKVFWIYCRSCGCEYLEPIDWVINDGITECPHCHNKLRID